MKIVEPSFEILFKEPKDVIYKKLERIGRTCYKSEDKITEDSAIKFVEMIAKRRHWAMIEHAVVSVHWVVDRGVSHEMVRHRLAAYAQESTRYCNYNADKFGNEITVICPFELETIGLMDKDIYDNWEYTCKIAEKVYLGFIERGIKPEIARSVLPTCLKTEIVSTFNLREWRHFFTMRADPVAHPLMRKVANSCLKEFQEWMPELFNSVKPYSTLEY